MRTASLQKLRELTTNEDGVVRTEALLRYVLSLRNELTLPEIHEAALSHDLTQSLDRKEFAKIFDVALVSRKKMFGDGSIKIDQGRYSLLDDPHNYDRNEPTPAPDPNSGPTLEEWVAHGYQAQYYPPQGYLEKPSPGLTKFREEQAEIERAVAEASQALTEAAQEVIQEPEPVVPVPDSFDLSDTSATIPLKSHEDVVRELNAMTKAQLFEAARDLGEKSENDLKFMNKAALVGYLTEKVIKR